MAATAIVNPAYTNAGPPPPYQSWSDVISKSSLVSPPDSRRTSDNKHEYTSVLNAPQIQKPSLPSLPSIHEALTGAARPAPTSYRSPVASSFTVPPPPSFSHPSSTPTRSYPPSEHTYKSSLQHQSPPPRSAYPSSILHTEPVTYQEPPRRSSLPSAQEPAGPSNPYAASRYEPERRIPETSISSYTHSHPPPPTPYHYGPSPAESSRRPSHYQDSKHYPPDRQETDWKGSQEKQPLIPFQQNLKRSFEGYDFENSLSYLHKSAEIIGAWSRDYYNVAQEQHRSMNTVPDRAPTVADCDDMIDRSEQMTIKLKLIRAMVDQQQQTMLADQRMREHTMRMSTYDEENGYEDSKHAFEGKKRRGRAAPPGVSLRLQL